MSQRTAEWIRGAFRVLGEILGRQRRYFLVLWLLGFVAYQLFLVSPFIITFGALPNYFKVYDAWGGIVESVWLRPPLGALWTLVTDQPVYEFGIRDRFGFTPVQFVATAHSLFTMLVLPPLLALSLLLQARVWRLVRQAGGRGVTAASASAGAVGSLFGASTSAVACCGASAGPVILTMLGFGFGTAGVIVEYADLLELGGYVLLMGNVGGLAGWLGARAGAARCVPAKEAC